VREAKSPALDWKNIGLMTLVHVAAIGGLALYLPFHGMTWAAAAIGCGLTGLTIFSISAGYHRLFSHRAYDAHPAFRLFLLFFGAGAFQNSALTWSADHRRHHKRTDTDLDPYNAQRGFWYAHMGWVLRKPEPGIATTPVPDLESDPLVAWQHRHFGWIGIVAGLLVPTLLGLAFGDPLGGFIIGAAVRLLVCYHTTFAINSFAHMIGSQPYGDRTSARDSFLVALLSMGEGYHNFHHTFPADYRNGVRAHHFDPTKWVLRVLELGGVVRNLRRTPVTAILRASLRMDQQRLALVKASPTARERIDALRTSIQQLADRLVSCRSECEACESGAGKVPSGLLEKLRAEARATAEELRAAQLAWRRMLRSPELLLA
jgi:stearoyl-CoA desaturase (delta-9 desaturase)